MISYFVLFKVGLSLFSHLTFKYHTVSIIPEISDIVGYIRPHFGREKGNYSYFKTFGEGQVASCEIAFRIEDFLTIGQPEVNCEAALI